MDAVAVSLPIFLIVALGFALMRAGFFSAAFVEGVNAFVYRVSLPALIVGSLLSASLNLRDAWPVILAFSLATLAVFGVVLLGCAMVKMPGPVLATVVQGSFRGNLAFVGLPILASAHAGDSTQFIATAVLVFAPVMVLYNVLAVGLFHFASGQGGGRYWKAIAGIGSNPLILAAVLGGLLAFLLPPLPDFVVKTLELLGAPAAPLALLCVGASMAGAPIHARLATSLFASGMKVAGVPVAAYLVARWLVLDAEATQILMVFSACPAAAASFIIARQLGGDAPLASNIVVLSTILSPISLTVVLWLYF